MQKMSSASVQSAKITLKIVKNFSFSRKALIGYGWSIWSPLISRKQSKIVVGKGSERHAMAKCLYQIKYEKARRYRLIVSISIIIGLLTIMHLPIAKTPPSSKPLNRNPQVLQTYSRHPRMPIVEICQQETLDQHNEDEQFSLSITSRSEEPQVRVIRRSMVNRSCINTCNLSCKNLSQVPPQIAEARVGGLQKVDLSFNSLTSLAGLPFEEMVSLKELAVNDNHLVELPYHAINCCRQLKMINLVNNHLSLLPPLTAPSYILARITAQLPRLSHLQFVTFDWLDYLLESVTNDLSNDRFKDYARDFLELKRTVLSRVDFSKEQNCNYCDFNCLFQARMDQWKTRREGSEGLIALQAAKAILKGDSFFLNYLRHYHNQLNYAALTHNSKLLLEIALQAQRPEALQLFKLRKINYTNAVDEEVYFSSLRACCKHSCYDIFKYLIHIRARKRVLQTQAHIAVLVREVIERYNRESDSDKILIELMRFWKEATKGKIVIRLPVQFSHKLFKAIGAALLDIYQHPALTDNFTLQPQAEKTTPLHFAMRSRNEELVKKMLQRGQDVFEKNHLGQSCRFVHGSTQVSRKMVWYREKQLIKQLWNQPAGVSEFQPKEKSLLSSARSKLSIDTVNHLVQSRIGYESLQPQFLLYRKPIDEKLAFKAHTFEIEDRSKQWKDEEILPHIRSSVRVASQLRWGNEYLKKMVHVDVALFLLGQVEFWKENDFMVRLQRWNKAYGVLSELFQLVGQEEDSLLKYELMQTMFRLTGIQNGANEKPVQGGNFWCCQNVVYE